MQNAALTALPRFTMLLSTQNDDVNVDRASLRRAGIQRMRSIRSGSEALRIIKAAMGQNPQFIIDSIIYSENMPDMPVGLFLRALAKLAEISLASAPPVLVITGNNKELGLALAQGATVALARPYSVAQLEAAISKIHNPQPALNSANTPRVAPTAMPGHKLQAATVTMQTATKAAPASTGTTPAAHVTASNAPAASASVSKAMHPQRHAGNTAAQKVATATVTPNTGTLPAYLQLNTQANKPTVSNTTGNVRQAQQTKPATGTEPNKLLYSRTGLRLLREGKYAEAQELLLKALRFDPLDIEAALGLARLHREQGNTLRAERWSHRAGYICLQARQPDRAEAIFARLPARWQGDHKFIEAQNMLQDGEYDNACELFVELAATKKKPAHELLGRACQFTDAPEYYMNCICDALDRKGYTATARQLEKRLLGRPEIAEPAPCGFLANFPRLQELVTIARFTMKVWRASEV